MTLEDLGVHPSASDLDPHVPPAPAGAFRPMVVAAVGLAVVVGLVGRFVTVSPMWLDEALTVNIARLPLGEVPEALRHDGAPPLYYYLLHAWMAVAGTGDLAARALSGLLATASLPLVWLAGRRLVGDRGEEKARWAAWAAVLLLASSPFAIRYATEARMYSLVVLLVLVGYLSLDTVLHDSDSVDSVDSADSGRRSRAATVVLGVATGLLLLTHYWSFFLVASVAALLVLRARNADPALRAGGRRALKAMVVGSLLFLPWLPSFLEQMGSTGTPWGRPPRPRVLFDVIFQFTGGYVETALPLALLVYGLLALGLFGSASRAGPGGSDVVALDLRGRPPGRMLAAVTVATMILAITVGQLTNSAFAVRYAAVVLPTVVLLAALGSTHLSGARAGPVVLGLAVVLGFVTSIPSLAGDRTSAAQVAAAIRDGAQPGDVVAYCPDQLGPAVNRLLEGRSPAGLVQLTFPRAGAPELVDWVGYEDANEAATTGPFARMLLDRAGADQSVWVVWAPGYRTFGAKCEGLLTDLRQARPQEQRVVKVSTNTPERPGLVRYPPR